MGHAEEGDTMKTAKRVQDSFWMPGMLVKVCDDVRLLFNKYGCNAIGSLLWHSSCFSDRIRIFLVELAQFTDIFAYFSHKCTENLGGKFFSRNALLLTEIFTWVFVGFRRFLTKVLMMSHRWKSCSSYVIDLDSMVNGRWQPIWSLKSFTEWLNKYVPGSNF